MVGFEKALGAVKVIKDQIQYRSQSLLNLARGYFSKMNKEICDDSYSNNEKSFFTTHQLVSLKPDKD